MTDPNFEAMSNPNKFPYGNSTFSSEWPRNLTYRKYFNQRLLDVDGRFATDLDYVFVAQYIVKAKQVHDDSLSGDKSLVDSLPPHRPETRQC